MNAVEAENLVLKALLERAYDAIKEISDGGEQEELPMDRYKGLLDLMKRFIPR